MTKKATQLTLVFVYNADSGLLNLLIDAAHRVVSPKTYPCRLCAITFSFEGMRREWKQFIAKLNRPVEFLHRDELKERHGIEGSPLPAVFLREGDKLTQWIDAEAINRCKSLDDLENMIAGELKALDGPQGTGGVA